MANKKQEKMIGEFLLRQLNRFDGSDYIAVSNDEEAKTNSDIDVYGSSPSKKFERLNLQMKLVDRCMESSIARVNKSGGGFIFGETGRYIMPEVWIKDAMKEAEKKYVAKHDLVLVLYVYPQSDGDISVAEINQLRDEYKESEFKGIYYISPKDEHNGQVAVIKNINIDSKIQV